jgi:hypothetical protein
MIAGDYFTSHYSYADRARAGVVDLVLRVADYIPGVNLSPIVSETPLEIPKHRPGRPRHALVIFLLIWYDGVVLQDDLGRAKLEKHSRENLEFIPDFKRFLQVLASEKEGPC